MKSPSHGPEPCASANSAIPAKVGGWGWIRTIEVCDGRFTVCSLWPLGNLPICTFLSQNRIILAHETHFVNGKMKKRKAAVVGLQYILDKEGKRIEGYGDFCYS